MVVSDKLYKELMEWLISDNWSDPTWRLSNRPELEAYYYHFMLRTDHDIQYNTTKDSEAS